MAEDSEQASDGLDTQDAEGPVPENCRKAHAEGDRLGDCQGDENESLLFLQAE